MFFKIKEQFYKNGFVVLKNIVEHNLINEYIQKWYNSHILGLFEEGEDWKNTVNYLTIKELNNIILNSDLLKIIKEITNADVKPLHVQTSWAPTTFEWHRDIISYKIAAWIALDTINFDCGPFQIISESHLDKSSNDIYTFIAEKGDILFWHNKSIHRGTVLKNKNCFRKSIICHYY